ncbi:2-keto-4-pentenoate hydratase/2-oxohepta-3-ene-1,7-dioic acid hydratase (catechol pathway) [Lutimaribacter pacificus]|uniref:2-keto-4-pentenoate hydratase/2-oxohepta-3-ene-1,7-dioic acid hydratase (Catechol pathway) n=1 Tax=Lutimaribacter pacificus TaxID=391948 RepID=A0A1H0CTN5_9RHOB|nr:fumarylacetoacetate hydrolase family protein [Lutimaribacter pacificus]SDN61234.1 2-keto-4-pentenoate hydratase/2-oxohepta-3-ene-1,7-dioic acid hydratase (catechol pathway) [Lutimaribacter pacificus]SHJ40826.1 2-keto-4-pentenoate hydratase/2-oxohepta-3-ene-1,7-dioic acid hydratase (catechol pathway) [Lutimaribacter pacificus]
MKLGTVAHEGVEKPVAVIDGDTLLDLRAAGLDIRDMVQLVEMGEAGLEAVRDALANPQFGATLGMEDVEMRVPIRPVQYRDCLVFEAHLKNCFTAMEKVTGRAHEIPPVWYEQPIYYKGNRLSFIGHGQDVRWPNYADFLDLELELAIIIGKRGTDIPAGDAPGYIWGYTILNDMTARDAQMVEMAGQLGPAKGKDFDTGNILGPWIVTADEIGHPVALDMEVRVNGTRWGGGSSAQMHHSFADIIAHISRSETLYPGEVIGSGTVGTGCGLELGKRLEPGDTFELEVEKIGILENRIVK